MANILKGLVLKAISTGARLPESPIDRVLELVHLRNLLRQLRVNLVFDVGANRGQFAHELRAIGYTGRIISFEPLRSEFAVLKNRFQTDDAWAGFQFALGSADSSATIPVPSLTVMTSLLRPIGKERYTGEETITVRRLDGVLPNLLGEITSPRVFLKMDTQGYDVEVFKGAQGCLDLVVGLQSELSVTPIYHGMPHYLEALSCYESAGFDLHNLSVVNRNNDGRLVELNCFMKRREASNHVPQSATSSFVGSI